ncbi:MAG: tetratricopeptide repeat protein [Desulfobacteraceae bacterium]|nr:tetratricopeptide repeat protein [Desulfobacteraceae bacterium]
MRSHPKTSVQKKTTFKLKLFQDLISEKTGIYINQNQLPKLEFAIQEQMLKRNIQSADTYFKNLILDSEEFYLLVERLTVNETYFLREPVYMELFSRRLIPELLSGRRENDTIKIISAGCSTGPEPYSLGMILMETYGSNSLNLFSIIGFDIDQYALLQAREGIYGKYYFRNFNPDLKKQYFQSLGKNRYKIKAHVQEMVKFLHLNLLANEYPPILQGADIIFYRNVSIYFAPDKQQLVFLKLLDLLNPGGYLITSATEVYRYDFNFISSKEIDGIFVFCKTGDQIPGKKNTGSFQSGKPSKQKPDSKGLKIHSRKTPPKKAFSQLPKKRDETKGSISKDSKLKQSPLDAETLFQEASTCVQTKKYDRALKLLDNLLTATPDFIKAWTLKAAILMNQNNLAGAIPFCIKAIEKDPLFFEGYFLAGLIAMLDDDPLEAIKRFQESLYIDPSSWLSHFYLAEIHRSKGDAKKAVLEYRRVIYYIEKDGTDIPGPALPYISFTADQIRHLCDHNIAQLKSSQPPGG